LGNVLVHQATEVEVARGEDMMQDTLTLKSGTVLHLKGVRPGPLRNLILQFGGIKIFEDPDSLKELTGKRMSRALGATEVLFNYCAAWGVTDDPPEEAMDDLDALGLPAGSPKQARANWLRYLELSDDDEMAELIGLVMALSVPQDDEPEKPDEVAMLKARIAELEGTDGS